MATDARYRMKVYLDTNITPANLTKDNGVTLASFHVCYAQPPIHLVRLFSPNYFSLDIIFAIGHPTSVGKMDGCTQAPYAYEEEVPVTAYCVDKYGITGEKLVWTAEAELRTVLEDYPTGSQLQLGKSTDATFRYGRTTVYGVQIIVQYTRSVAT